MVGGHHPQGGNPDPAAGTPDIHAMALAFYPTWANMIKLGQICQNIGFFLSINTRREGTNHHECIIIRTDPKRTKNNNPGARAHDSPREYPGMCNTCVCVCV